MPGKFKIFISYRRKGGYDTAKLIYDRLRMDGYSVSFDIDTLESGNFDNELEKRIKKCKDFILILSPGIFDCFSEENYNPKDDWVRIEIACAIKANKNIVPLVLEDFTYPKRLPGDIKDITRKNSIDLNPKHFEAAYEKMKEVFLLSKPYWKVRHKKRMRNIVLVMIFTLVAYLSFMAFSIYKQKDLETQKAILAAQEAHSIRIAKEIEMERMADSLRILKEQEIAQIEDSIKAAAEAEMVRITDSITRHINAQANNAQKKAAVQSSAKTPMQSNVKAPAQKPPKNTPPKQKPKKNY
jgi:hypothetical protein